jgi:hypothetical protein
VLCCGSRGDILPTPTDLINTVRDIVKQSGLTLIIEPGRSMVATSSALVNTVTGARLSRGELYSLFYNYFCLNELFQSTPYELPSANLSSLQVLMVSRVCATPSSTLPQVCGFCECVAAGRGSVRACRGSLQPLVSLQAMHMHPHVYSVTTLHEPSWVLA